MALAQRPSDGETHSGGRFRAPLVVLLLVALAGALARPNTGGHAESPPPIASHGAVGISFASDSGVSLGTLSIYSMDLDGSGTEYFLPGDSHAYSPDGSMIAYGDYYGPGPGPIVIADRSGETIRTIDVTSYGDIHWSPSGKRLAFLSDDVAVVNVDGTGFKRLAGFQTNGDCWIGLAGLTWYSETEIAFSNAGRYNQGCDDEHGVFLVSASGGSISPLIPTGTTPVPYFPVVSPDGANWSYNRLNPDTFRSEIHVCPKGALCNTVVSGTLNVAGGANWSPDNEELVFGSAGTIYAGSVEGGAAISLGSGKAGWYSQLPAFEPEFSISGAVTRTVCSRTKCAERPFAGVKVTAQSAAGRFSAKTGPAGTYDIIGLGAGTYTVTPQKASAEFDPASQEVDVQANVSGIDFTACAPVTQSAPPTTEATGTACSLHIDWKMPDRFQPDRKNYSQADGVLTPEYVNPKSWEVNLFIRDGRGEKKLCTNLRYDWSIRPASGGPTINHRGPVNSCRLTTTVPTEGTYTVEARETKRKGPGKPFTPTGKRAKQKVVVQDWLILGIGDSMASGEGNPDIPGGIAPRWQFQQCHRSYESYQARVASRIEKDDPHTSVTFIHTACSGAKVGNLYNRDYAGIEPGRPLRPQLQQIQQRLGKNGREVDAVIMSIGVNDLFFGTMVEFCAKPPGLGEPRECMGLRVKRIIDENGEPALVKDPASKVYLDRFERETALASLPGLYGHLNTSFGGVSPSRIFFPTYPDPATDEKGHTCTPSAPGSFVDWSGFTKGESAWFRQLGTDLNARVGATEARFHWKVLTGNASLYLKRGFCSTESWFQTIKGSLQRQGNVAGAMHPIGPGPAASGNLVSTQICMDFYKNKSGSCTYDPVKLPDGIRPPGKGSRLD